MTRIATVVGARPQFIKAAAVCRALRFAGADEWLIHTGQHYDEGMSDVFFRELEIPSPRHHLGVGSGRHGEQTGRMMTGIESCLVAERPDVVLLYGDTNSTLAGALAASKLGIRIAHVEAGLRSFNRAMPEEINRVLTDHLSAELLCPTLASEANLRAEGIGLGSDPLGRRVHQVGDVMFDASRHFSALSAKRSTVGASLGLGKSGFVLTTVHRAENTDDPTRMARIAEALGTIARRERVVWPVHPRTRRLLDADGGRLRNLLGRVELADPVGYLDMLWLEGNARVVVTDSGGVQKEAFFAGVPCVTLRDETEWVELVESGWNVLAPPVDGQDIAGAVNRAAPGASGLTPYGDGRASERIAAILSDLR